ncbi:MAG: HlyD family efflux transporter periplasmic adaptor subunit [Candidatus Paceibacterota bacterium]|jgi:multidrug efflux pump subunit AcrA (membrane-fusion protein)
MTIITYVKRHRFIATVGSITIILLAIILGRMNGSESVSNDPNSIKKVELVSVSTFREGYSNVPADGIVESNAQADLKSQVSALISSINVNIGDPVYAGQTIIVLQNADIQAQLAQAEASLALAKGQFETGDLSLDSAKSSAMDKIRDAYTKAYETVFSDIDPLLYNYDGRGSHFSAFVSDYTTSNEIQNIRIDLSTSFRFWKNINDKLNDSSSVESILSAVSESQKNLTSIDRMLENISEALNDLSRVSQGESATTVNTWKTIVALSRSTINGSIQTLTGAKATLSTTGSTQNETAPAQIRLAEAGVNNLKAQLAKTIIRSPINGRVAALPLRSGELATPGLLLATVVGEGDLLIKAFASSEDSPRITQGASVTMDGGIKGTVQSFSPSLSFSNKKVEVIIKVLNPETSGLIVGDSVHVSITVPDSKVNNVSQVDNNNGNIKYILPIQNVKIIPGNAFVFTVDSDSKIVRNEVTLGEVRGDFIEIKSGLRDDMNIVSPVYELDEGQQVKTD